MLCGIFFAFVKENTHSIIFKVASSLMLVFVIWIPSGIRYGIGTDYFSYLRIFQSALEGRVTTEIGYYLINYLVVVTGGEGYYIFLISSLIIALVIVINMPRHYSCLYVLIFFCIIYLPSFSLVRQSLAVVFLLVSIKHAIENKILLSYFFALVAISFHLSSLLILPFIILRKVRVPPLLALCMIVFCIIFFLSTNILQDIINSSFIASTKYGFYADTKFGGEAIIGTGGGVLIKALLPLMIILQSSKIVKSQPNCNIIILLSIVAICASIASLRIHIFSRVSDLFMFLPLLGVTYLMNSFSKKITKQICACLIFLSMIVLFERTIATNLSENNSGLGVSPYTTIFDVR